MAGSGQDRSQDSLVKATPSRGRGGLPIPAKSSWTEWKNRCALSLCHQSVQDELRNFASVHFALCLRRYSFRAGKTEGRSVPFDGDAWHLFETHLAVRNTRQGKKYKEWLFARLPGSEYGDLEALAGGAALLIRDVAREHLRREYAPSNTVSMDSPVYGTGDAGLWLGDLLPGSIDPADEVARREFEGIAADQAQAMFHKMEQRVRVVFLAKELRISLAHAEVEKAAGCRKSALNESYHAFIVKAADEIKERFSGEDTESVRLLTVMILQELKVCAGKWARASTELNPLLSIGRDHEEAS